MKALDLIEMEHADKPARPILAWQRRWLRRRQLPLQLAGPGGNSGNGSALVDVDSPGRSAPRRTG